MILALAVMPRDCIRMGLAETQTPAERKSKELYVRGEQEELLASAERCFPGKVHNLSSAPGRLPATKW